MKTAMTSENFAQLVAAVHKLRQDFDKLITDMTQRNLADRMAKVEAELVDQPVLVRKAPKT